MLLMRASLAVVLFATTIECIGIGSLFGSQHSKRPVSQFDEDVYHAARGVEGLNVQLLLYDLLREMRCARQNNSA